MDVPVLTSPYQSLRGGDGYELRCPREFEALIPEQYGEMGRVDLGDLPCPVKAISADPAVPDSFMPSVDLSELMVLDYDFVPHTPDTTHFLLLEEPEECVGTMLEFLVEAVPDVMT